MLKLFYRRFIITMILSLSTPAAASIGPVLLEVSPGKWAEINGSQSEAQEAKEWRDLTPQEKQIFHDRRTKILEKLTTSLKKHTLKLGFIEAGKMLMYGMWASPKQHAEFALVQTLNSIDSLLISKAKEVASCESVGVCSSAGIYMAIGYKKWATGLGVLYSVDWVRSFSTTDVTKTRSIEFDFPRYIVTKALAIEAPAALGGLLYRIYIHMDSADPIESAKGLEVEYFRVAPVKVTGPNTVGFGFYTGIGVPPYLSSLMHSRARAVRVSCTQLLGAAKKLLQIEGS